MNVGDKVKIQLTGYVDRYKEEIAKVDGKEATITERIDPYTFRIDIDNGKYTWNIDELKLVFHTDPDTKEIANVLHKALCKWNHIDGCDWYYHHEDDFTPSTKKEYYVAAKELLKIVDKNTIVTMISILKNKRVI